MLNIQRGTAVTRKEKRAADAIVQANALPTFHDALELMISVKTDDQKMKNAKKRTMSAATVRDYRSAFNCHLTKWADMPVDELPIYEIATHLNQLQETKPYTAQHAAVVASAAINHIARVASRELQVPRLLIPTKSESRAAQGGNIDMTVPLLNRWKTIGRLENEHKRLLMQLTVYTGLRQRPVRELTWDRVYRVEIDGKQTWALNLKSPVKHQRPDREIVLGDDASRIIDRLRDLRRNDCDWVFPGASIRKGNVRPCMAYIDKFFGMTANTARHYWMPIARTHVELATVKWLALHSMKAEGFGHAGTYGAPSHRDQYEAANVIASKINTELGMTPQTVIELHRNTA